MKTWKHGIIGILAIITLAFAITACKDESDNTHTHDAGTWVITQQPTCTEDGVKERQCTVDHVVLETGVVSALGHDWNTVKEVISTVSETTDGVKAIKCQRDSSHTKDEETTEYATGTAGLEISLNTDDTYWVRRGTFEGAVVHIPAYHRPTADDDYLPVTRISGFGYGSIPEIPEEVYTALTTVTFAPQNQLREIGTTAFQNCSSLASITIPTSVTSIRLTAFNNCTSLTSITIPASVTTISNAAFGNWTNTQTINVPFANDNETPVGWNENWNRDSNAVIKYWNGTTWE